MNKKLAILPVLAILISMLSCQKQGAKSNSSTTKTIKFILYTNKDFSDVNDTINFSLTIKKKSNITLLDSALTSMRIKDIPGPANKMIFQKTVPDDGSTLIAGFNYNIKNIGYSWFLDTVSVSEKLKVIEYSFQ
jgi:hypothetical protein